MDNTFKKAAIVGAGLIGTGFAVNCVMSGVETVMRAIDDAEVGVATGRVEDGLEFFVSSEVITTEQKVEAMARLRVVTSLEEAVTGADYIIECVPEKLDLKRAMVAEIEKYAAPDVVIASTTSGMLVTDIFAEAQHPERGVGGHPYHPAYLIPLVEVVKGEKTGDEYAQRAKDFYTRIGKEPVVLNKEVVGFIANRFQSCIHREMLSLVMDGVCSVEDADKALVYSVGMRWAVVGQAMALHLGAAPEGLANFTTKYHMVPGTVNKRMDVLATWNVYPDNWDKILYEGLCQAIEKRPPATGRDMESIERWRDKMLVEILKLHKKYQ